MSELKVTFKLDGVAEEAAKAYKTIQDAFKSKKVSFSEWLESGGETESKAKQAGRKTGKKVMEGIEEGMKDESKRYQRVLEKMANEGEKKAKSLTSGLFSYKAGKPTPNVTQGLREITGSDVNKILGLPDINQIQAGVTKGLREVTGKDLAKVLDLGDINDIMQEDAKAANVMAEAMDDLSKRGSQAMVDMQAAMAMADSKINADIEKNIEIGKKEAASYEERAKKAEEAARRKKAAAESAATADKASFLKNISLLAGPVFNPGGVLSTMFAARQTFSALMTQTGQQGLQKTGMGQGIGAAAMGTAGLIAGATGLGFILKGLEKTVSMVIEDFKKLSIAYKDAAKLYSATLQSGLGLGFTVKRISIANILGVSEQEVNKFSYAIAKIAQETSAATKALAESTLQLTKVEQETKKADLAEKAFNAERARTYSGLKFLSEQGRGERANENLFFRKKFNDLLEKFGLLAPKAEQPIPSMKQLPSSTWEKMGLVVGSGGQGTNDLIRKSNGYLKTIADHVKTAGSIPRSFGLDPKTANP